MSLHTVSFLFAPIRGLGLRGETGEDREVRDADSGGSKQLRKSLPELEEVNVKPDSFSPPKILQALMLHQGFLRMRSMRESKARHGMMWRMRIRRKRLRKRRKRKRAEQWAGLSYVWWRKWPPSPTSFTSHPFFFETRPAFTFGPLRFREEEHPTERQASCLSLCHTGGSQQDEAARRSLLFLG